MPADSTRPDWTRMQPWDFDSSIPPALFEAPMRELVSTGDDLLSLLEVMS